MARQKPKLTRAVCDRAVYQGKGPRGFFAVRDSELPGFMLRISQAGKKRFIVRYRFGGRIRELHIGDYPFMAPEKARRLAMAALTKVHEGIDPADIAAENKKRDDVRAVAEDYMRSGRPRWSTKTIKEYRRQLERDIYPAFGRRRIDSVTRREIAQFLETRPPVMANRIRALLRAIYAFAIKRDYVPHGFANPCDGIERNRETARTRWLNSEEEARLMAQLDKHPDAQARHAITLLLNTGLRKSELLGLRWEDVDLAQSTLTARKTKNHRDRTIPLNETARRILADMPRLEGNPFVFWSPVKSGAARVDIENAFEEMRDAAGIENLTLHDLRRTFGSKLISRGTPIETVSRLLGHSSIAVTERVYAHMDMRTMRLAVSMLDAPDDRVLSIEAARRRKGKRSGGTGK